MANVSVSGAKFTNVFLIKEISNVRNGHHFEWREGLSDINLKGDHTMI
jgi:hypothetical protein